MGQWGQLCGTKPSDKDKLIQKPTKAVERKSVILFFGSHLPAGLQSMESLLSVLAFSQALCTAHLTGCVRDGWYANHTYLEGRAL